MDVGAKKKNGKKEKGLELRDQCLICFIKKNNISEVIFEVDLMGEVGVVVVFPFGWMDVGAKKKKLNLEKKKNLEISRAKFREKLWIRDDERR